MYDAENNPRHIAEERSDPDDDDQLQENIRVGEIADTMLPWATGTEWARFLDEYVTPQIAELTKQAVGAADYPSLAERRGAIRALQHVASYPDNLRAHQARGLDAQVQLSRLREDTLEGG